MSRVGKRAVAVPAGITASVQGQTVAVKGPKGALSVVLPDEVPALVPPQAVPRRARATAAFNTVRICV